MSTRALLVESEQLVADMIRVNLENHGFELEWVKSQEQAIELLKNGSFDLMVVGVDLGNDAELDLVKGIRQRSMDSPLVVLTSGGDVKRRVRTLELGADDYLSKPFDMAEFMARIDATLKRHANT